MRLIGILGMTLGMMSVPVGLFAQSGVGAVKPTSMIGCYRLTLGPWSGPFPQTGIPEAHTPPSRFRLDSIAAMRGGFAVEPSKLWERSRRDAEWRPLSDDSLSIVWSTGFIGVRLQLLIRGDTLRGRATTFHDAHPIGEPPDPSAMVLAVREACPRPSPTRPDSVVLERTNCLGSCPAYRLAVYASGRVAFESRNRGDEANRAADNLPDTAFARILTTAAGIGFDTMPPFEMGVGSYCRRLRTDAPTITVTLFAANTLKRLSYYTGCISDAPHTGRTERLIRQLRTLADSIDAAVGARRWIRPGTCC